MTGRKINQGGYPVIGDRGEAGGILRPVPHFFTATAGQTVFPITPDYQPGVNCVYVWKNSEILWPGTEFTETASNVVTLATPADLDDKILIVVFYVSASVGGPTGPAGGVLSGDYPNPGFAVDMATQAELNQVVTDIMTLLAAKANTNGNNAVGPWGISITGTAAALSSLSGLPQGGATIGQVLKWNGVTWAPADDNAGGGGGGAVYYRIVVIGDSYTAQQPMLARAWPHLLEDYLNASGTAVEVFNLAINGWTFHRANTEQAFGDRTALQVVLNSAPNMVIVALGFNDQVMGVGGRTLAQSQADALAVFTTLRNGLPAGTKIVYASQLAYDDAHAVPSNLLNRHVIPFLFQQRSSGILANTYNSDILPEPASAATRTSYGNWLSLDTYVKSLSQIDSSVTLPIWKAARMGLVGYDGIHLTAEGHIFLAAAVRKVFKLNPLLIPGMSDQNYPTFDDPDAVMAALLTNDGTQYVERLNVSTIDNHPIAQKGPWRAALPQTWYLPSKGTFKSSRTTHTSGTAFTWSLTGFPPLAPVSASFNLGAFQQIGETDARGYFIDSGIIALAVGAYTFYYKIGNEVYGPLVLNVIAGGASASASAVANLVASQTLPSGVRTRIRYERANAAGTPGGATAMSGDSTSGATVTAVISGMYRISMTVLVNNMAANALAIAGFDLWMGGVQANLLRLQGGTFYPPLVNYAGEIHASFTLYLTAGTICIPWVLTTANAATLAFGSDGASGNFLAIEYIAPGQQGV